VPQPPGPGYGAHRGGALRGQLLQLHGGGIGVGGGHVVGRGINIERALKKETSSSKKGKRKKAGSMLS